jgi:hypothetical protein
MPRECSAESPRSLGYDDGPMCGGLAEVDPDNLMLRQTLLCCMQLPGDICTPDSHYSLHISTLSKHPRATTERHVSVYRHTDGIRVSSRSGDFPYADFGDCQYLLHLEAFLSMRGLSPHEWIREPCRVFLGSMRGGMSTECPKPSYLREVFSRPRDLYNTKALLG